MRFPTRSLATLLMMAGVATCSDTPIAAVKTGSEPGAARFGRLPLVPAFSKSAQYAAAHLAEFPGLRYDSIRVVLRRLPTNDIVRDTTLAFNPQSAVFQLNLDVDMARDGRQFSASIVYRSLKGDSLYWGTQQVEAYGLNETPPTPKTIPITYVGPGHNVKSISVSQNALTLSGTQAVQLSVTAIDSSNNRIVVPLNWTTDSAAIADVDATGLVRGHNRRGSTTIRVSTPIENISDAASVTVVLPPAAIAVVSGSDQTGKVGTQLPSPAVVQVSAADGIGVAGVSVVFSAPTGGSVSSVNATTDASGRASTTLKLGTVAGPQGFAAVAAGFSVGISATATAGDPSTVAVVSGGTQTDSIHAALAPLVVRVTDSFGNPVPNAVVNWSKSGAGTLAAATSTTGADGQASNSYKLGGTLGAESVTASAGTGTASFGFTVRAGSPATIVAVSGGAQSARVAQPMASPFIAKVADAAGNPVQNAAIAWSGENVAIATSSPSDASGQASATATAGGSAGVGAVIASIANGQRATFPVMILAGPPSTASFSPGPSNVIAGQVLPSIRVLLRDDTNNPADGAVTIALANNPNGAVLGGTLTQTTVSGVATFNNLSITRAGTGYTLRATTAGGVSVTSAPLDVAAGAAATMTIVAGNGASAKVNTAVATPPTVRLVDGSSNPIIGATVTFAASSGSVAPASGVVKTDALGIATLTSWTLGTSAGTQTLTASAVGVQPVTFTANAEAGSSFKLVLKNKAALQASAISGGFLSPQPAIQLTDEFGNAVPAGQMQVSVSTTTAATVTGTTSLPVGVTNGVATFTDLKLAGTGATRLVFTETSGRIKPDTSNAITLTPISLRLYPSAQTAFTFTVGQAINLPQVKAVDAQDNGVAGVIVHAQVDSGTGSSAVFIGAVDSTTNEAGLAHFAIAPATTPGSYRVRISSPRSRDSLTLTITVNVPVGVGSRIQAFSPTSLSGVVGAPLAARPAVLVQDAASQPVPGTMIVFTIATNAGSVTGAAQSETVPTNSNGIATMSNWTLPTSVGSSYMVTARAATGTLAGSPVTFTASAIAGSIDSLTFVSDHGIPNSGFENDASYTSGLRLRASDHYGNVIPGIFIDATTDTTTNSASSLRTPGPSAGYAVISTPPALISTTSAQTDTNGIADFGSVKFRGQAGQFRLRFVERSTGRAFFFQASLRHGAAVNAICPATLPGRVRPGHHLSGVQRFTIVDVSGNIVAGTTVGLAASDGSIYPTSVTTDPQTGEVNVTSWDVRNSVGEDYVKVNGMSGTCHVRAANANRIKLSLTSLGRQKNGRLIPSIDASVVDADDIELEDESFSIEAAARPATGKAISISGIQASDKRGRATFDNLVVDGQEQTGAYLKFSSLIGNSTFRDSLAFDIESGDPESLDSASVRSARGIGETLPAGTFSVQVKDHGKQNNLNSATNVVTWTLGTGCANISFLPAGTANPATIAAIGGIALSPGFHISSPMTANCAVTASAPGLGNVSFTITP